MRISNRKHPQDLEAHYSSSPHPSAPASFAVSQPPTYVRSGRGGAGNFAEPPTLAETQAREDLVDRTDAAVSASLAGKPRAGLSGRGGAGNWTTAESAGAGAHADDVQARQAVIEDKVVHEIEASLPLPPKTYHQHDRQMEK